MAIVLVRDLDDEVYERLKARAAAEAMRRRLEGRPHSDSGEILAEERLR